MSEFRRQHWAAAVDRLFTIIRQNLITFLIIAFAGSRGGDGYFFYVLLGTIVLTFFSGIASWYRFRFRIVDGELQIKKGIIVRKQVYMSKERIQVIDITEGIVQRIFGLVKVEVKTAGGGTETATINAITQEEAEELKRELKSKSKPKTDTSDAEDTIETYEEVIDDEYLDEWTITTKELVLAAFTSGNFGLIASILGATSGQLDAFVNDETIDYVKDLLPGMGNVTFVITIVIAILLISWTLSFLGVIFNYSDFSVKKTEKELHIRSGLIERKHITIPFNRIQAIRFTEGILRQPLGCGMLYVESAGFEVNAQEKSITLVPFISRNKMHDFFDRFLDGFHVPEFNTKPPKKAFFRYLRRPNYWLFVAIPAAWFFWDSAWLLFFLIIPMTVLGYFRFKDAGIYNDSDFMAIRYRLINRKWAFLQRNRVQVIDEEINPFQNRKNLSSLTVTVASGAKGTEFEVNDLEQSDSAYFRTWLTTGKTNREDENKNHSD